MTKKTVSYIFPIYDEAENIPLLYGTLTDILATIQDRYAIELIFVNDGSQDASLKVLHEIQQQDDRVTVVNFSRNFGHQIAVTAGLDHATGDAIIIMDSDMQDPPRVSLELIQKWEEGYDVVYAQRRTRKDTLFKRLSAAAFYWMLRKLADIDIPPHTGDFRLIDRRVASALSQFREHNRFLRGLVSYVGFKQTAVLFDREARHAGKTSYPLKKMIRLATDGIVGFSWSPLKLSARLGYLFSGLSFAGIIYALGSKVMNPDTVVPGWTFIVIAMLLIGGVQLIILGLLGSYIGRIYVEAQNRPLYIIESVRKSKKTNEPAQTVS